MVVYCFSNKFQLKIVSSKKRGSLHLRSWRRRQKNSTEVEYLEEEVRVQSIKACSRMEEP